MCYVRSNSSTQQETRDEEEEIRQRYGNTRARRSYRTFELGTVALCIQTKTLFYKQLFYLHAELQSVYTASVAEKNEFICILCVCPLLLVFSAPLLSFAFLSFFAFRPDQYLFTSHS